MLARFARSCRPGNILGWDLPCLNHMETHRKRRSPDCVACCRLASGYRMGVIVGVLFGGWREGSRHGMVDPAGARLTVAGEARKYYWSAIRWWTTRRPRSHGALRSAAISPWAIGKARTACAMPCWHCCTGGGWLPIMRTRAVASPCIRYSGRGGWSRMLARCNASPWRPLTRTGPMLRPSVKICPSFNYRG